MKNAVPALLFGQNDGTLGPDDTWLRDCRKVGFFRTLRGKLGVGFWSCDE